jgi:hypothetical protein
MIYENLIYSIFFGLASFLYYKIHKGWRNGRDENSLFFKPSTTLGTIENWIIILALGITSIVFLFKSI